MSGFAGFSEADIQSVHNGRQPVVKKVTNIHKVASLSNKNPKNLKLNHTIRNQLILNNKIVEMEEIPIEAKLVISSPMQKPETEINTSETLKIVATNDIEITSTDEIIKPDFQTRQKLMEEQNRRRKELLTKALADRTQKTQEEQQRLNEIQLEFKKLDVNLSNDVKILRKQIEMASLDYMHAQKTYLRIEKEYLAAKLFLHNKLDKKELLTEHLCTIIEQNEEMKAKKLNELLSKLQLNLDEVQNTEVTTSNGI